MKRNELFQLFLMAAALSEEELIECVREGVGSTGDETCEKMVDEFNDLSDETQIKIAREILDCVVRVLAFMMAEGAE